MLNSLLYSLPLSIFFTLLLLGPLAEMLSRGGLVSENFRNKQLVSAMGLSFGVVSVLWGLFFFILARETRLTEAWGVIGTALPLVLLLGLLDDMAGLKRKKGVSGHIQALACGSLTTGGLKAIGGLGLGYAVAWMRVGFSPALITDGLLVALFTNFINLFDLRPGRAIKVYLLFVSFFIFKAGVASALAHFFIPQVASVITYLPHDLREKTMIGDTGANFLGFNLGIFALYLFDFKVRFALFAVLVGAQIAAEKVSFGQIIAQNRILSYLDSLGRTES